MKKTLLFLLMTLFCTGVTHAQVFLTGVGSGSKYTQNFNSVSVTPGTKYHKSTLPSGWFVVESGAHANDSFAVGDGSDTTGDSWVLGTSSDWSLGGLSSDSIVPSFGIKFTNNTAGTITKLYITYKGETWRVGAASRSDSLRFSYSTDSVSWNDVTGLDYVNPGQTTGSGSQQHADTMIDSVSNLLIQPGETFWFRWDDVNVSGADDAMGIDDFEIYAESDCPDVTLITGTSAGMSAQCTEVGSGWTYYGPGPSPTSNFAIKKNGNTIAALVDVTVDTTISKKSSNGANQQNGMFLMGYYWDVSLCTGCTFTSNGGVSIRFYYHPDSLIAARSARDTSFANLASGSLAVKNSATVAEWFQTVGVPFDGTYIASIVGNRFPIGSYKKLTPTLGVENGISYVQFDSPHFAFRGDGRIFLRAC